MEIEMNRINNNIITKFVLYAYKFGIKDAFKKSYKKIHRSVVRYTYRQRASRSKKCTARIICSLDRTTFDILSFPIMPWFSRFQRSQQLLTEFAEHGTRVFRVDTEFFINKKYKYSASRIRDNIIHILLQSEKKINMYNECIDGGSLKKILQALESLAADYLITNPICIFESPFWYPVEKAVKERYAWHTIYDCMDEMDGFRGNYHNDDSKIAADVSLVTVSSEYLYNKMITYNKNCTLIRNAADFSYFSSLPINNLLRHIKRPIIGYVGAISEWFDFDMIIHAAKERNEWNFILVGACDDGIDLNAVKKLSNVRIVGEIPYRDITKYMYWFDVCIIPFKITKLTKAVDPIKFYEYISSGKPVVSTMLPEILYASNHAYFAKDKYDFVQKIESALNENNPNLIRGRIDFAKNNTWQMRYEEFRRKADVFFPFVSIIIVTYNNVAYTKRCIESIFSRSHYPKYEIIIVDNNSSDETCDYLKNLESTYKNIRIILNDENRGFAAANNQGIFIALGEYIILLNNDTVVTFGWVSRLVSHLRDENIGMVGPRTNSCGNEAIMDVPYNVRNLHGYEDFILDFYRKNNKKNFFDIDTLGMFCVAMRKKTIEQIGHLDERFEIGMFEDDDYSYRLKQNGYRVVCAKDAFIHHFGSASFSILQAAEYKNIFEKNRKKFEDKWKIKSTH